jgi:hypothetical protein
MTLNTVPALTNTDERTIDQMAINTLARIAAVVAISLALAGCVHKTAYLTKQPAQEGGDPQIARCEAKGFGLIPMVLEEVAYDDCMTFYRNHGYAQQ